MLLLDFETRGVNTFAQGTDNYVRVSEPLLCAYAVDDGPVKIWRIYEGDTVPSDLNTALSDPAVEIWAHNAAFDYNAMLAWGWGERYPLTFDRVRCSMIVAHANRLPGALGDLCKALQVSEGYAKKDGNKLINLFCSPANSDGQFRDYFKYPEEWEDFIAYAIADVKAMRECLRLMPAVVTPMEWTLYAHTLEMNRRGVNIDRELANAIMVGSEAIKHSLKKKAATTVGDPYFNLNSQKAVHDMLKGFGVVLEDMRRGTVERFLGTTAAQMLVPPRVLGVLADMLNAKKAAPAKAAAFVKYASPDNRMRHLINFGAAGTGRDTSKGPQLQNMARPMLLGPHLSMEQASDYVKRGAVELMFDEPMQLLADTVRGIITPQAGRKLCVADLSSIEGRVLPWLAQDVKEVHYFRDLDAGVVKYDGYHLAYATAFGVDPNTVSKEQRTIGKPISLACGFGGSVGALMSFAAVYDIDVDDMANKARQAADPALWDECAQSYEWFLSKELTYGLSVETWTGCYYIIKAWRRNRGVTQALWQNCESSFRNAINHPGTIFGMAHRTFVQSSNGWVFVQLPSGRMLVYPHAHEAEASNGRRQLAYAGVNPFTRKWGTTYTYGGKLAENITQAVARDVMMYSIPAIEQAGYPIVLRVHDELVTEPIDHPQYTGEHLARMMATNHSWCPDLPLNAVGEDLYRYQK